jgi:phage repressor protein C with HTH and peptisase S24 domain
MESGESTFQDRIEQIANDAGGAEKLADLVGFSRSVIYNYINGDSEPNLEKLVALSKASGRSVQWLATGHEIADESEKFSRRVDFIYFPRYEVRAAGGAGAVVESERIVDFIGFKAEWVHSVLGVAPDKVVLISACGDSMEPTISDGDLLLVDTAVNRVGPDAIYALASADILQVKRIQKLRDGSLRIISDNPKYEPEILSGAEGESIRIVGRVIWRGGWV